ncbi:TcmI family type II polyketide cyclase [Nonomuraea turkmeniaca]|uniref:TcmI family type II polyketide cyclase n=1 Tax=Nonomuraea turkmeniaca TaxID=103838 RepID=A0A5S4F1F8_9ACTN|nr:TcmI family type II polyketide cyclase [Nonomuraea turkmeniaca]TMR09797.1 TcmI family type II polyketide cyclase [Nonomuraea turkmeniaca]
MTDRSLIVARLEPGAAADVARLFGASDATPLPLELGVVRRHLFQYHDLYFHYVEFDGDARAQVGRARDRADFQRLSADLDRYVKPFDPATWRSPADAMASEFYGWERRS